MGTDWLQVAYESLASGGRELHSQFPRAIKMIIRESLWIDYPGMLGKGPYKSFPEFSESEFDLSWSELKNVCCKDADCLRMLDEILPESNPNHRPKKGDIVPLIESSRGNSASHALSRLKRDHPELAQKVIDGELSANAAAIQAGFRKPMKSIPVDCAGSAISALLRIFSSDDLQTAINENRIKLYDDRPDIWALFKCLQHAPRYKRAIWSVLSESDRREITAVVELNRRTKT